MLRPITGMPDTDLQTALESDTPRRAGGLMSRAASKAAGCHLPTPTVCPSVASRNLLLYQSLPSSIPYRQAKMRMRKDESRVGTASRGIVKRLRRFSPRVRPHGGPSVRLRYALSTMSEDRGGSAQYAALPGGLAV